MTDWKKYEVPDWVVDDYNSRVPEKDRMPLGSYGAEESYDSHVKIPMTQYASYQKERGLIKKEPSPLDGTLIGESPILFWIFKVLMFLLFLVFVASAVDK